MTLTTVFDPYRAAQAIADIDLIKAANPGCYTLAGVPYVATLTPTGIVLAKAGRRAAPGQMSLFSAPSSPGPKSNKNVGRTKTKDGVTYRLNENSRWERVKDANGQQSKPSLSIVKDDLPSLENLFARADEVGSKYQDPTDPADLGAQRAADAIVDEAMGGLTNEARGVADLGARRKAKKINEEERIANTADSMKRYHDRMTAHQKTKQPQIEAMQATRAEQVERNAPEWTTFEGEPVIQVPGSNHVAVPVNGRKNSAKFDIISIEPREYVTQLNKNEVNVWLAQKAIAAENDATPVGGDEAAIAEFRRLIRPALAGGVGNPEQYIESRKMTTGLSDAQAEQVLSEERSALRGGIGESTPADPYHAAIAPELPSHEEMVLEAEVFRFLTAKATEDIDDNLVIREIGDLNTRSGRDKYLIDKYGIAPDAARNVTNAGDGLPQIFTIGGGKVNWHHAKASPLGLTEEPKMEDYPDIKALVDEAIARGEAKSRDRAEAMKDDPLKNVPYGIQSKVKAAVQSVKAWNQKVKLARQTDQQFQGGGRYTWEATNGEQMVEPKTIQLFRDMSAQNGVDADAALAAMGYEPPTQLNHKEMNTETTSDPSTMTKAAQTWEDYRSTAENLHKEANPEGDGDPCWEGYEQVGTKKKRGKTVPNCVPMQKTVSLGGARYALSGSTLRRV